ncbi:hypothetical protein FUA23_16635 [Neolewinella aurantiaca]|uniref:Uncharacterized protein n=1 Tax=Neolewinella aurantiaca TaxID=2602767 RepID=A0A5C7FD10_9BACT|nr:hypothetical protein [Neolewinella aurantiaca]TXF87986.1 hypothetical protein FUA23_16635 [Neolewinella aurantiaca]
MNNKDILIVTLGTRDVQLPKSTAEEWFGEKSKKLYRPNIDRLVIPRVFGQAVLKHTKGYENNSGKQKQLLELEFPILKPALDFLRMESEEEKPGLNRIGKIIFIVTDQSTEIDERYRANDSIHFAELLKRIVPLHFDELSETDFQVKRVTDSVQDYVENSLRFFTYVKSDQLFNNFNSSRQNLYLLNLGGIDAINQSLSLALLNRFGEKVRQLSVSEEFGVASLTNFPIHYQRERESYQAKRLIENYNYSAIKTLNSLPEDVIKATESLDARLGFDFDRAKHKANAIRDTKLKRTILKSIQYAERNKVKELYRNARIKLENENYVDFLLRLYRLTEEYVRTQVGRLLPGIEVNVNKKRWESQIKAMRQDANYSNLFEATEKMNAPGGNGKIDISFQGVPAYLAIWKYYEPTEAKNFNLIISLNDLRNKSIGAHDFEPVSRPIIEKELKKNSASLEQLIASLDDIFLSSQDISGFDRINQEIFEALGRMQLNPM